MTQNISNITDFLLKFDALKSVNRRTYIHSGERLENSAEHSWHLAMACWAFAEFLNDDFDIAKLIKLALIHDLGEMEAGDTFLYSTDRNTLTLKSVSVLKSSVHIQEILLRTWLSFGRSKRQVAAKKHAS